MRVTKRVGNPTRHQIAGLNSKAVRTVAAISFGTFLIFAFSLVHLSFGRNDAVTASESSYASRLSIEVNTASAGQDVDSRTRDLLIEKLSQVQLNLAPNDISRPGVALRLADLLSERARQSAMAGLDSGTSDVAAMADRKAALKLYLDVVDKIPSQNRGKVNTQIGHLYELLGDEKQAIAMYQKILSPAAGTGSEAVSDAAKAEAHLSLAEIYFKKRDFPAAQSEYQAVLSIPEASSRGLAAYRLAWCKFNQGQVEPAIAQLKTILGTPALLTRSGAAGTVSVDPQFQDEVSRDLVTFLARRTVTPQDMQDLYKLSSESAKLPNLIALAVELERVGQNQEAIAVWHFHQERQPKPIARLEGQVHLAQTLMASGNRADALKEYQTGLNLYSSTGQCSAVDCVELKNRMRKFILDWNRVEKKSPSPELLATYQAYLTVFPAEDDMRLWAAQVATQLKNFDAAMPLYKTAIQDLSSPSSDSTGADSTSRAATQKSAAASVGSSIDASGATATDKRTMLEAATLSAIEAAELSKKQDYLDLAYDLYIKYSPEKKRLLEVRYQQAHLIYERGENLKAADALHAVAVTKDAGPVEIKRQAADLALDSVVLASKEGKIQPAEGDAQIEAWAQEFAKIFPSKKDEYLKLARTSILNQALGVSKATSVSVKNGKTDRSPSSSASVARGKTESIDTTNSADGGAELERAWSVLSRFPVSQATPEERITYYKNRLVLAEKLHKFAEAREAANFLVNDPHASTEDREYALTRKAWLAEMVLDFDSALTTTEKISTSSFAQNDQKWLKLALFSELAAKDPRPFYEKYLKESKDGESRKAIAIRLVRESTSPMQEFEKQKAQFKSDHDLYSRLALEVTAKTGNIEFMKKALKEPGVAQTAAGKAMSRSLILRELDATKAKFAASKLLSGNQKQLATSLKGRVKLIENLEAVADQAVHLQDWTAQLLTLDYLAKESDRFYQEILQLPVPVGLSTEEEQQYLQLLSQQASPHQVRAQDLNKKVAEFWQTAEKGGLEKLRESLQTEHGPMHQWLARELAQVEAIAPAAEKTQIASMLSESESKASTPSRDKLEDAKRMVREHPLGRDQVANLLNLEKQAGHSSMVAYLETRLAALSPLSESTVPNTPPFASDSASGSAHDSATDSPTGVKK